MYNINQRWIKRISFQTYLINFLQMYGKHWGVNNCHSSTVESTNRERWCEEHQGSKQQEKSSFHPWTDWKSLKLNNEPSEMTGKSSVFNRSQRLNIFLTDEAEQTNMCGNVSPGLWDLTFRLWHCFCWSFCFCVWRWFCLMLLHTWRDGRTLTPTAPPEGSFLSRSSCSEMKRMKKDQRLNVTLFFIHKSLKWI